MLIRMTQKEKQMFGFFTGFDTIFGILLILHLISTWESKVFFQTEINSKIVKSNDWQMKSIDYYLEDGIKLNFLNTGLNKIAIGDSVSKEPNTFYYKVYRRQTDHYTFFATYDYRIKQ